MDDAAKDYWNNKMKLIWFCYIIIFVVYVLFHINGLKPICILYGYNLINMKLWIFESSNIVDFNMVSISFALPTNKSFFMVFNSDLTTEKIIIYVQIFLNLQGQSKYFYEVIIKDIHPWSSMCLRFNNSRVKNSELACYAISAIISSNTINKFNVYLQLFSFSNIPGMSEGESINTLSNLLR